MEKKRNKKSEQNQERKPERVPDSILKDAGDDQPDNKMRIVVVLLAIAILGCVAYFGLPLLKAPPSAPSPGTGNGNITLYFFYGKECPHCHNVMPYVESLQKKYPDVDFRILEVWHDDTNNALLSLLNHKLGRAEGGVPEIIIGNISLLGEDEINRGLEPAILWQKGNQTGSFQIPGSSAGPDTSLTPASIPAGGNISLK